MENYAEIREKAWAAINAARQQKQELAAQQADAVPSKTPVTYVDSKDKLMEVLLGKKAV